MKYAIFAAATLAALTVLYLFLIFPRPGARRRFSPFLGRVYAHRGIFDNTRVPENSMASFCAAVRAGVGIELDIHLTSDGVPVVFHDNTLERMCGDARRVEEVSLGEIRTMRLLDTDETVPTLAEVLSLVGNRVPLIVELKGESGDTSLADVAMPILENARVRYAVESFNPLLVARYRRLAPHVMRGVLTTRFRRDGERRGVIGFVLQRLLLNVLARPDFIASRHVYGGYFPIRLSRRLGAVTFAWTVRERAEYDACRRYFDAFICENIDTLLRR